VGGELGAASPVSGRASAGRRLALLALVAANLALVLTVSTGFTPLADIIAPLTGHLLGIGLAASLALLARRRMLALLTAGVAVTIGLHGWLGLARCCRAPMPMATESGVTKISTHHPGSRLTVLALNTWDRHGDPDRLARYLATAPADVVVLSQLGPDRRRLLARLEAAFPFQVVCSDARPCALALLSRLPLEAAGAARIAPGQPGFVWARLGGSLTVIGTHLDSPGRDPWLHERQMSALARFIRRIDGPLVLAGDLNTSPWSNSFRRLRATTSLVPAGLLMPSWPAWPLALPQMALDHILVSPELTVAAAGTGPAVGSDHLPVWAQLERHPIVLDRRRLLVRRYASRPAAARAHLGAELLADLGGEHVGARDLRQ